MNEATIAATNAATIAATIAAAATDSGEASPPPVSQPGRASLTTKASGGPCMPAYPRATRYARTCLGTKRAREMAPRSGGVLLPPEGTLLCGRCGDWGEVAAEKVWWWCATCVHAAPEVFTFEQRAANSLICNDLQSRNEWLEEQLELLKAQLKAANEKAGKFDELQRILSS